MTTGKLKERKDRTSKANMLTLQEILSNGLFESDSRALLRKPGFFFGDAIIEEDRILCDGDYKWLRQIGDRRFFLPNMERMYPLSAQVGTPRDGVGSFQIYLWHVPRQIGC